MSARKLTTLAVAGLMAALISAVENYTTPFFPVPGVKPGLANIVLLAVLLHGRFVDALVIVLLKTGMQSLFGVPISGMLYALPAGVVSAAAMAVALKARPHLSLIGVSVTGAFFHNATQVAVSCVLLSSTAYLYYLPLLIWMGTATGLFTGTVLNQLERYRAFRRFFRDDFTPGNN